MAPSEAMTNRCERPNHKNWPFCGLETFQIKVNRFWYLKEISSCLYVSTQIALNPPSPMLTLHPSRKSSSTLTDKHWRQLYKSFPFYYGNNFPLLDRGAGGCYPTTQPKDKNLKCCKTTLLYPPYIKIDVSHKWSVCSSNVAAILNFEKLGIAMIYSVCICSELMDGNFMISKCAIMQLRHDTNHTTI